MSSNQLDAIERSIKEAKETVEFGAAVQRLRNNSDFKKVIAEGFFQKEAVRLVHLLSDANMQSPDSQKSILNQMASIGALSSFLTISIQMAQMAEKNIESDEATREEILAETL